MWVQYSDENIVCGSDGWRIVPEPAPATDEPVVEKHYGDSFEDMTPDQVIAHTNLYWRFHTAPGRTAETVDANGVGFGACSQTHTR